MMTRSALRIFLWNQDSKCHWCEVETYLTVKKGGKSHSLDSTIDHYFSKYRKAERIKWGNPVVLACYRCNHDRGSFETSNRSIEELHERARQSNRQEIRNSDSSEKNAQLPEQS